MELKPLSYFLATCQKQNLSAAATSLEIAQSTLSSVLSELERTLEMPLFRRSYNGLHPTAEARWLCQQIEPLLLAERLAMRLGQSGSEKPLSAMLVKIRLRFTLGRVSRAVSLACASIASRFPGLYVEPQFDLRSDSSAEAQSMTGNDSFASILVDRCDAVIELGYEGSLPPQIDNADRNPDQPTRQLVQRDDWVAVIRGNDTTSPGCVDTVPIAPEQLAMLPISILDLPAELVSHATEYCRRIGVKRLLTDMEDPGALPRLSAERSEFCYLLPKSLLSERFENLRIVIRPLAVPLTSALVARISGKHEAVSCYLDALRGHLNRDDQSVRYRPDLTIRQFRYFSALGRATSMTATARSLNLAQPALTKQLQKLEKSTGVELVQRKRSGHRLTPHGVRLHAISRAIENAVLSLNLQRTDMVIMRGNHLTIGVLPTAGSGSLLLDALADTVKSWLGAFPKMRLSVLEGGNQQLQEWVDASTIGFALVDAPIKNAPRLPLVGEEPLCVVHAAQFDLLPDGPVRLADIVSLDLAAPTQFFGLRSLIDGELMVLGRKLNPVVEVNSFQLCLKLLGQQPFATLLPRSAVADSLADGTLVCHEIVEPQVCRRLSVIFSPERSLSDPERAFVRILRDRLGDRINSRDR